jgi:uncharacterized protein YlbG (UPF0298 family)
MENKEFPETFDLSLFIPDAPFDEIINRFENGRTVKDIQPRKNKVLTVEEFKEETKETKREKLIERLETLEKALEKEYHN